MRRDQDLKIREYRPGDEEGIVDLLSLVFNKWPRFDLGQSAIEHWRWKYATTRERPICAVAEENDELIGCWHRVPCKIKFGQEIIMGSQGADVAVHPEHRGKRISSDMRDLTYKLSSEQGANLFIGVNTNKLLRESSSRRGFKLLPSIFNFFKIQDMDLHTRRTESRGKSLIKLGYATLSRFNRLTGSTFKKYDVGSDVRYSDVEKFDAGIDVFWEAIKDHYRYISVRDKDYLNWRYCDPRGGKYFIKQAEENGEIIGYCVLRVNGYEEDYPTGYIVDLMALPDKLGIVDVFIQDSISFLNSNNVNIIKSWNSANDVFSKSLIKHGFVKHNQLFVQFNSHDSSSNLNSLKFSPSDRIIFCYGDSDSI